MRSTIDPASETVRPRPSIARLVEGLVEDFKHLIAQELRLARHEILGEIAKARTAAAGMVIAAGIGAIGGLLLILALVHGLHALGLPMWASYGLVAVVLLGTAGFFFLRARKAAENLHVVPIKTAQTVKENATWLKDRLTSPPT